jgi:hypothetical protein
MQKVNVVFDDVFDDADIILIPDKIERNLRDIVNQFFAWSKDTDDPAYWTVINGKKVGVLETRGFIDWINNFHLKNNKEKALILEQHTNYNPIYPLIEW